MQDVASKYFLPAAAVNKEFRCLMRCRMSGLPHRIQTQTKNLHPPVPTIRCAYDWSGAFLCMCACETCDRESGEMPDPESSARNVRHYPVELSALPFISIKTCNNACTLGRNCFQPFGSVQLDCEGEGVCFCVRVFCSPFFLCRIVSS